MFNLEQAIAEWRRQMLAAGIKTPVPLDELESHLRDDIEQQIQSGTIPQQAFEAADQRLGGADEIKSQFKKGCRTKNNALRYGGIGLVGTVMLNLAGRYVFHRGSSVFFSPEWWAAWSTNYIIWTSLAISGMASCFAQWRLQRRATRQ